MPPRPNDHSPRISWLANVACDYGGPVIVATRSNYEKWTGADPYPLERRRVLHYWGQFTHELPAAYRQEGGHVYREHASLEALVKARDELLDAVTTTFADVQTTIDEAAGTAHLLLPDGRQMWVEQGPLSQYEEACAGEGAVWSHAFQTQGGEQGSAVFWEKEGAGDFFVGVTAARDELLLLRTWVDEDELDEVAKAHVDAPPSSEQVVAGLNLMVDDEPIIVAYAPHHWRGIVGAARVGDELSEFRRLLDDADGTPAVMLAAGDEADVATALTLVAGTYTVSFGNADSDDEPGWACLWCRFVRTG